MDSKTRNKIKILLGRRLVDTHQRFKKNIPHPHYGIKYSILKMEATSSSETFVMYLPNYMRHIAEDVTSVKS